MIVLTEQQKDFLNDFKIPFMELLDSRYVDIIPIPINNGLYILPEKLLYDPSFSELKQALIDGNHLANIVVRDVGNSELIEIPFL